MAISTKDIKLLISAEDRSSKAFKDVAATVATITDEINKQSAAAAKGEASLDRLAEHITDLKKAGDQLVQAQGLVESFRKLGEQSVKAGDSVEKARAKLDAYRETLKTGGDVTDAQSAKLSKLEGAFKRASDGQERLAATSKAVADALRQAGLATDDLDANSRQIAASALAVGQGLATATAASKENTRTARENAVAQQEQARAQQEAARAFAEAARTAAANMATQKAAYETASKAADAFRKAGEQAVAAARGYTILANTSSNVGAGTTQAATAIRQIIDPASAARASLAGLETQIAGLSRTVAEIKGPIKDYEVLLGSLSAAQAELSRKAGMVDAFSQQMAVVRAARTDFVALRAEVIRLGEAQAASRAPSEAMNKSLADAKRAADAAARALENEVKAAQGLRSGLQGAGVVTSNLAQVQKQLATAAEQTVVTTDKLKASFDKFGRSNAGGAIFGLSPYAIQNLGYQVNDLFTQVASGTSIMQAAAQQGGQVLQIFPGVFGRIAASAGILVPLLLGAGVAFGALSRAADDAAAKRQFEGTLALMADGSKQSATQLVALQREITRTGTSFSDAGKIIQAALSSSFDINRVQEFAKSAQELADIKPGLSVVEAFTLITDAAQKGYPEIIKLQEATGLFTAAQMAALRAATDTGNSIEQQRIIAEGLTRTHDAAEKSTGAWTKAWRDLKNAVSDLYGFLANTAPVQIASAAMERLANLISNVSVAISRVTGNATVASSQDRVASIRAKIAELGDQVGTSDAPHSSSSDGIRSARRAALVRDLAEAEGELTDARKRAADAAGPQAAAVTSLTVATERQRAADADALRTVRTQLESQGELTDAQVTARRVREALSAATAGGTAISADARAEVVRLATEQAGQENLERRLTRAAEDRARVSRDGASSARIEAAALRERNKAATEGVTDEAVLRRIADRGREEERGLIAREKASAASGKRIENGERETANQISALIAQAASRDTQSLENRLNGVNERYERIFRQIDKFRREGGTAVNGVPLDQLTAQVTQQREVLRQQETMKFYEEALNQAVQERTNIYKQIREEQQAGLITGAEAIQRINEVSGPLQRRMEETARAAVTFAEGLRGATPNPRLEAFIAKMNTQGGLSVATPGPGSTSVSAQTQQAATQVVKDSEAEVNRLFQERAALVTTYNNLVAEGAVSYGQAQDQIKRAYDETQPAIDRAIQSYREANTEARNIGAVTQTAFDLAGAKADQFASKVAYIDPSLARIKKSFEEAFATNAVQAFDKIGEAIAGVVDGTMSIGDAFKAAGQAALQFLANVLKAIAQAIIQEQALIAVKAISKSIGGFHGGGIVGGSQAWSRSNVDPSVFAGAPRFHSGTVVGLKSDEQAAILQKGEEVLSADNPRNVMNMAKGGGSSSASAPMSLRQVLVFDESELQSAMASPAGEKVFITHVKKNAASIRQMIRG